MSSSAAKLMAGIGLILTLVLAVVLYRISHNYAENAQKPAKTAAAGADAPVVPKTLAVVALKPLAAYQAIGKDDVALVEVSIAPADYYTSVAQVVGKEPIVDVDGGAPVTKRYFGEGNLLARAIPAGFQAISVEINDVVAVGGFVRPGDMVDVLLYLRDSKDVEAAQARVLLKQVRVLAYEDRLVERPEGLTEADDKKGAAANANRSTQTRRTRTAVLAVPETDTTRLMLGASQGELRLALYGQSLPGVESEPVAEITVAGGLPASSDTLAKIESYKVPDKALSMQQLSRIKPPPAKQNSAPIQVPVYRAAEVQTVAVKP
ncbi:MAG: Pilus assembly protein CpaB [Hydrocarboniphaga sp.]|uniref:Flp pilus assembly protein CpaB n=1 Tax=Hydrocarboniphaga sp. TaxID=2033016 RepID=UPI0026077680|nr:Flp pilus assembly protein CpaB [Hydrocarboniphaga sp.]MDB5972399.1 Pilus assembly protein CpaB [Hydrocarboniphaga sp.]